MSNTYQIKFVAVELLSKNVTEPKGVEFNPIEFKFNFTLDIKLRAELKLAAAVTDINIVDSSDNELAKFKTACFFEFPEFENVFKKIDDKLYHTPTDLDILLKTVSLSTTRGILYGELRGTFLQNAVLPIIDVPGLVLAAQKKLTENQE